MDYQLEISLNQNDEFENYLHDQIKAYNNEHSIHHKEARKALAVKPIHIIVKDMNEEIIGGISSEVYWNWLEIKDFWLKPTWRKKGLGSILIQKVEEIAKEKGAIQAMLTTFEFHAPKFYEKQGYKIVGVIKDYPPGSCYYTMVKIFNEKTDD